MSERTKNIGQEQELDNDQLENAAGGGDGTTEHFFTVEIAEGRIAYSKPGPSINAAETGEESPVASIRRISPDTIDPAS
jgi:hypothetical protein